MYIHFTMPGPLSQYSRIISRENIEAFVKRLPILNKNIRIDNRFVQFAIVLQAFLKYPNISDKIKLFKSAYIKN